jgi:hypothetical protein
MASPGFGRSGDRAVRRRAVELGCEPDLRRVGNRRMGKFVRERRTGKVVGRRQTVVSASRRTQSQADGDGEGE